MHRRAGRPAVAVAIAAIVVGALAFMTPAGAVSPAPDGPSAGSIGIRLVDAPVDERNDPRAHVYIVDHLKPGTVIHRRVGLSNTSQQVMHPKVYPDAARIRNGSFIGLTGQTPNELTSWTSVRNATPTVSPGQLVTDTVTIKVPKMASRGERYAVIWAQITSPPSRGHSVTVVNRVGIRIYLSVGPGGAPPTKFTIASITAQRTPNGTPQVVAKVRNTGGRAIDISGSLRLTHGPGGLSAGPFAAKLGTTLAPGDTEPVTIPLDRRIPDGPWRATLTLRSGFVQVTAVATIRFPNGAGANAGDMHPAASIFGRWMVISGGGTVLVLAGLLAFVLVHRQQRRFRTSGPS
jgi:hypothetical protein